MASEQSRNPVFLFGVNLNQMASSSTTSQPSTAPPGGGPEFDLSLDHKNDDNDRGSNNLRPPHGKPFSSRLPDELVGNVVQVWELLWRFHEVLEVKVPSSFEKFEEELLNPWSICSNLLGKSDANDEDAHCPLLKVLIRELQSKVAAVADPTFNTGATKSRQLQRDVEERSDLTKNLDMPPINELTWPELARRIILTCQYMDGSIHIDDITSCKAQNIFRCLRGDGGVLCSSVTGEAAMETNALILAEANEKIFGHLKRKDYLWPMNYIDNVSGNSFEATAVDHSNTPEWVQLLEPVRKLRTNVGSRIRNCIYNALQKDPPDWVKKVLVHSISKEVYKANSAGPTKKAVLSVLSDARNAGPYKKPVMERKGNRIKTVTDLIMEQCRKVLHCITTKEAKVLCNMLGTSFYPNVNVHENPPMLSRPLDFKTIDLRLAVGAYCGSHEAFLEDVNEVWDNIRTACRDQPDLMQLASKLSQYFEILYKKEVLALVKKCLEPSDSTCPIASEWKEPDDVPAHVNPWEEGVCKACGVDKDDDKVLLCDTCDSEYHTYCLNPPLARIPEGNWYCPLCVVVQSQSEVALTRTHAINVQKPKKYQEKDILIFSEKLQCLASTMKEKEYSELLVEERILLIRFLCDEVLDSSLIRRHLEHCDHICSLPPSQPGVVKLLDNFESQISKVSLRRDLLGRDSSGRLYWVLGRPGTRLQLVVDGSIPVQLKGNRGKEHSDPVAGSSHRHEPNDRIQSSWVFYESTSEIEGLLRCLRDSEPMEKELKQNIMQWLRLINQDSRQDTNPVPDNTPVNLSKSPITKTVTASCLTTQAFSVLNQKYGPCLDTDFTFIPKNCGADAESSCKRRLYRCECLEPVWPSRQHCFSCHQTFSSIEELKDHNDRSCNPGPLTHNDSHGKDSLQCKEMITSESTNVTFRNKKSIVEEPKEGCSRLIISHKKEVVCPHNFEDISSKMVADNSNEELVQETGPSEVSPLDGAAPEMHIEDCCTFKPLAGKFIQILRCLKITLLDMEAALPEEALKPSKAHLMNRFAWQSFVKSAESIYELIQATIVFENMIMSQYLRSGWWYWSSLSAAVKASTISSLALRIYSLDAAIIYVNTPLNTSGLEENYGAEQ